MTLSALGMGLIRPFAQGQHDGLTLDFVKGNYTKRLSGALPTRYASATELTSWTSAAKWVQNAAGLLVQSPANQPALEWLSGGPLGAKIERARTNVLIYSEAIQNFGPTGILAFGSGSGVVADASPTGASGSVVLLTESTSNSHHVAFQFFTGTAVPWTLSCFMKRPTSAARRYGYLQPWYGALENNIFDLQDGVVASQAASTVCRIQPYANGWYRCSVTKTISASSTGIVFGPCSNPSNAAYVGDGGSGILTWGAMAEVGGHPSTYIPTTTAAATRAADTVTIANSADVVGASSGSVLAEFMFDGVAAGANNHGVATRGDAPLLFKDSAAQFGTRDGTTTMYLPAATMLNGTVYRAASSWGGAPGNLWGATNIQGSAQSTSGAFDGAMGSGEVALGVLYSGDHLDGWLRQFEAWPARVADAQMLARVA